MDETTAETVAALRAATTRAARRQILARFPMGALAPIAEALGVDPVAFRACKTWRAVDRLILDQIDA